MKKISLALVFFVSISLMNLHSEEKDNKDLSDTININKETGDSYAENVHMYICIEALKLLKDRYPQYNFTQIENRIGTMNDIGTRPWQTGKITTGAHREDIEDPVFDIRGPFGFYSSNSHFWNADNRTNGDHSLTTLNILGFNTDYPNAYTKICRYVDGQWFAWSNGEYHERKYIEYNPGNGIFYRYSYHTRGLINFFRTKKIWLHSYINTLGQTKIVNKEITLDDIAFGRIVWEVLGRMSHLVQDMTTPAHTHNDVHVRLWDGGDCYHNYVDDGGYLNYNWQTAKDAGGLINPYGTWSDPVRYAMYSANQLGDHFPSGPDCHEIPQQHSGDNNLPGGTYPVINQYYQQLGPPPPNITNVSQEAEYCFNHAIRATAGLFYWFAVETGIISPDPAAYPVIYGFTKNLPDNMIYRGETLRLTCNASGSNLNYSWFTKVCDINNWCNISINGLSLNRDNNIFSIVNNNFQNRWTCSYYDSLCDNNSLSVERFEDPLHFYAGLKLSNQFGEITKYYNMNDVLTFNPVNAIREPYPPIVGCPVVFTKDTNGFICENNILNGSPLSKNIGIDIEDKLIIESRPFTDTADHTLQFAVSETSNDHNYFDKFELFEIDHPGEYTVTVTLNNDIVLTDLNNVKSPKHADKFGLDVTSELEYDSAFGKFVKGEEKEIITAQFSPGDFFKSKEKLINGIKFSLNPYTESFPDSIAVIIDPFESDVIPWKTAKREIGHLSVTDTAGIKNAKEIEFTRRQKRTIEVIPVMSGNDVSMVNMTFKQPFDLSYLAVAKIFYGGYIQNKLEMVSAENSLTGDIYRLLSDEDKNYAEMDSTSFIILKFKNSDREIPEGWKRNYILTVKGRSAEPEVYHVSRTSDIASNQDLMNSPGSFFLYQNFPNPFNPLTLINYTLPVSINVSLKIYDLLGKLIAEPVNELQKAGNYSVTFDGINLPSGVYYYKITAGNFTGIRKMILIK